MKRLFSLFSLSLILAMVFGSCTVEKRVHMSGYHIEWNKKTKKIQTLDESPSEALARIEKVGSESEDIVSDNDLSTSLNENPLMLGIDEQHLVAEESSFRATETSVSHRTESFSETQDQEVSITPTIADKSKITKKETRAIKRDIKAAAKAAPGGKSQVIALILVLLVGVLGIHRFYLGYTGIGILMLLTGGLCGILALIDLIRIITGDLKPANGEYSETL